MAVQVSLPSVSKSGGITVGKPSDVSQNSGPSDAMDGDKTNGQNLFLG